MDLYDSTSRHAATPGYDHSFTSKTTSRSMLFFLPSEHTYRPCSMHVSRLAIHTKPPLINIHKPAAPHDAFSRFL